MKKIYTFLSILAIGVSTRAQIMDTLPVIVHIIYNGEAYGAGTNLDSTQVYSQFDVLNEDYRMLNADIVNTPSVFAPLIADMGLNFAKATVDPSGNPLTELGIDRINRTSKGFSTPPYSMTYINSTIKPQTVWDPYRYLNIWVMNVSGGLLGYCTFPNNSGLGCLTNTPADTLRDGIVVHYCAMGRTGNVCAPYHKGRTATYEIAQWLGLKRLAQASCGDDCVSDTPIGDYSYGGCPAFPQVSSLCINGPNGDMFCNFLSYVDDSCKMMFTQGQKDRIDTALSNGTFQSALRLSNVAQPLSVWGNQNGMFLNLFPNPTTGILTYAIKGPSAQSTRLDVLNGIGEVVMSQTIIEDKGNVNLEQMPAGMYLLRFSSATGVITRKLSKH